MKAAFLHFCFFSIIFYFDVIIFVAYNKLW